MLIFRFLAVLSSFSITKLICEVIFILMVKLCSSFACDSFSFSFELDDCSLIVLKQLLASENYCDCSVIEFIDNYHHLCDQLLI